MSMLTIIFLVFCLGAAAAVYGTKTAFNFYRAERMLGPTWLVEAKLGALRDRLVRRDSLLWAAAVEHALSNLLAVRAEIEGDDRGRPLASLAMKYTVWPDHLKLKLAYGARSGPQAERRANLGLQYEF